MPSYMNLVVLALAVSSVSPALSAPVHSSRNVRGQSLSHRAFNLGGLVDVIKSKLHHQPARVAPEPEGTAPGDLADGPPVRQGPTRVEKLGKILGRTAMLAGLATMTYAIGRTLLFNNSTMQLAPNFGQFTRRAAGPQGPAAPARSEEVLDLFSRMPHSSSLDSELD